MNSCCEYEFRAGRRHEFFFSNIVIQAPGREGQTCPHRVQCLGDDLLYPGFVHSFLFPFPPVSIEIIVGALHGAVIVIISQGSRKDDAEAVDTHRTTHEPVLVSI